MRVGGRLWNGLRRFLFYILCIGSSYSQPQRVTTQERGQSQEWSGLESQRGYSLSQMEGVPRPSPPGWGWAGERSIRGSLPKFLLSTHLHSSNYSHGYWYPPPPSRLLLSLGKWTSVLVL
jgi:hypothetical protein